MKKFEDLDPYHKEKIIQKARKWRLENYYKIQEMMKTESEKLKYRHSALLPEPPVGSTIFDPSKWSIQNWFWFSETHLLPIIRSE